MVILNTMIHKGILRKILGDHPAIITMRSFHKNLEPILNSKEASTCKYKDPRSPNNKYFPNPKYYDTGGWQIPGEN